MYKAIFIRLHSAEMKAHVKTQQQEFGGVGLYSLRRKKWLMLTRLISSQTLSSIYFENIIVVAYVSVKTNYLYL